MVPEDELQTRCCISNMEHSEGNKPALEEDSFLVFLGAGREGGGRIIGSA